MRAVIDASAVLSVLLDEDHADLIVEITRGMDLVSPDSLPFEIVNALSRRMRRRDEHRLDASSVAEAFASFRAMGIVQLPQSADGHAYALDLAGRHNIHGYDAYVIAAAQSERAPLLTLDGIGRKSGLRHLAASLAIPVLPQEA